MVISREQLANKVDRALKKLIKRDKFLLEKDVNERTIAHKLGEYLQQEFDDWNVDCEYNRYEDLTKKLDVPKDKVNWDDVEAKTVFPDIIIHHRGINENLLVIEIKKSSSILGSEFDARKLEGFTSQYGYRYGLFIKFYVGSEFTKSHDLEWYKDGKRLHGC